MNKTIGSLPIWQFVLLMLLLLGTFAALGHALKKRTTTTEQ